MNARSVSSTSTTDPATTEALRRAIDRCDIYREILKPVESIQDQAIVGQTEAKLAERIALASGYGCLLIGEKGAGKSRLSLVLASSITGMNKHNRIQGTVDLRPSGVVGSLVYNPKTGGMTFRAGPAREGIVVLHIDEINRIPEVSQAVFLALLEEGYIMVDDECIQLDDSFTLVATLNEADGGSYPIILALMDRMAVSGRMAYGTVADRHTILRGSYTKPENISAGISSDQIVQLRDFVQEMRGAALDRTLTYITDLTALLRGSDQFVIPRSVSGDPEPTVGHRAEEALLVAATVVAIEQDRSTGIATPGDVQRVAVMCIQHRVTLSAKARQGNKTRAQIIEDYAREAA